MYKAFVPFGLYARAVRKQLVLMKKSSFCAYSERLVSFVLCGLNFRQNCKLDFWNIVVAMGRQCPFLSLVMEIFLTQV